ncbi:MAG: hypothetical protein HOC34_02245 [Candidatus Magasanikbacteria bacterium]|nr:hypothetical protein [Candidatus Magasanikbacteria bacterium]MBT4541762.1 hypothetical protein [Candidatus Magasanikbacteria bacterium]MBT6252780.1 hypothetical protein [Candidatus Magasanikbacteria bacterium]MBT6334546.1 hypothetical protein [Candidatus Magasanikbacteria bacterium]
MEPIHSPPLVEGYNEQIVLLRALALRIEHRVRAQIDVRRFMLNSGDRVYRFSVPSCSANRPREFSYVHAQDHERKGTVLTLLSELLRYFADIHACQALQARYMGNEAEYTTQMTNTGVYNQRAREADFHARREVTISHIHRQRIIELDGKKPVSRKL